ncbi:MAG: glucose-6-phosphate dehydrogenase [Actinomycetota bacterium]
MTPHHPSSVVIVLFGATGDLACRMVMPAMFELEARGLMPEHWRLVGSAGDDLGADGFTAILRTSLEASGALPPDWDHVAARTRYLGGFFSADEPGDLPRVVAEVRDELAATSGSDPLVVFFLAVPPSAFPSITMGLGRHGLAEGARVVFEKPYGTSSDSFEELDALVKHTLREDQVFRIDHFLGKEGVQAIYTLRFANKLFGAQWDRHSVAQVQVDVPETLNVANRASFYEATGAALDMLVTHLFQVVSQVAMDTPFDLADPDSVLFERDAVLHRFRPLDVESDVVLGQFQGYRDLDGVHPDSEQDTFVAARLWVDSDRWRGVPFILRTGKMMARKAQLVTLVLRPEDDPLSAIAARPNTIEINFSGAGGISLGVTVKAPGPDARLSYGHAVLDLDDVPGGEPLSPYASLIDDVLRGDRSLFTTEAGLRAAFRAFEPLLGPDRPRPLPYAPGGWGPEEARRLVEPSGWMLEQLERVPGEG